MVDWIDPTPIFVSNDLRDAVGGHPLVAETLVRRGITTPSAARAFLNPSYYTPSSPQDLPDLDVAVDRIWHALQRGERIAIWGDFDVDGQTATALLVEALRQISSYLNGGRDLPLSYQVPLRDQGHGIDLHALDELLNHGVTLLITCDTGVDALAAGEAAATRRCDMIITDHHRLASSSKATCGSIVECRIARLGENRPGRYPIPFDRSHERSDHDNGNRNVRGGRRREVFVAGQPLC